MFGTHLAFGMVEAGKVALDHGYAPQRRSYAYGSLRFAMAVAKGIGGIILAIVIWWGNCGDNLKIPYYENGIIYIDQ